MLGSVGGFSDHRVGVVDWRLGSRLDAAVHLNRFMPTFLAVVLSVGISVSWIE
jgi:hypothetical protein